MLRAALRSPAPDTLLPPVSWQSLYVLEPVRSLGLFIFQVLPEKTPAPAQLAPAPSCARSPGSEPPREPGAARGALAGGGQGPPLQ